MAPSNSSKYAQDNELPLSVSYQVPNVFRAPSEILNKYGSQLKRLRIKRNGEQIRKHFGTEETNCASLETGGSTSNTQVLSAVSMVRMAEMVLSQSKSHKTGDLSDLGNAFGFDSCLTVKHAKHFKRLLSLLDAAEKLSDQQYDQAEELLVSLLSNSCADHPIERVVLRGRIDVKKRRIDLEREVMHLCEQKLPFIQISHFTGIQTILDTVASAERIHFVDIGKKLGSYWILMMDALANRNNCNLKQLKILENLVPGGVVLSVSTGKECLLAGMGSHCDSCLHGSSKTKCNIEKDHNVKLF